MPTYIRVKDLPNAATSPASDDFILLSGTANGARRISRADFLSAVAGFYTADPSTYKLATLDAGNKVLVSQLPSAAFSYKGTWAASSNTPSLANGTGTGGDTYYASDSGSVNFGAGSISFLAGDAVVYDGTIWQKVPDVVNLLDGKGTLDEAKTTLEIPDVGLQPNQVPLSGQLGTMAFQDADGVSMGTAEVETLEVTGQVSGNLTVSGDVVTSTRVASDTINGYTGASVPLTIQTGGAQNLILGTNATERVRIDSSGNTGFGQPNPSSKVDVNGVLTVDSDYPPTSAVGGLNLGDYQSGGYKWIQSLNSQPLHLNPTGNNVHIGANLVMSSGGIDFGSTTTGTGTVATNGGLLDDYEFGTFTVTTNSDATGAITSSLGEYTKIGRLVNVRIVFDVTTNFTSNKIGGLPFTVNSLGTGASSVASGGIALTSSATDSPITCYTNRSDTTVSFAVGTSSGVAHNPSTTNLTYRLQFSYHTDD